MSKRKHPHFEAYVSIDIENPLNRLVYELRELLSDKKMVVMPVDIPLFGQYDSNMSLIRKKNEIDEVMSEAVKRFKTYLSGETGHTIKVMSLQPESLQRTSDGRLLLKFEKNEHFNRLKKCIHEVASEKNAYYIIEMLDIESQDPYTYVILKSHVFTKNMTDIEIKEIHRKLSTYEEEFLKHPVEVSRATLYHKEAVPLTRIQSWDLL